MDKMLNFVPYIVVKEYFFKNTASTMVDFVQNIADQVTETWKKPNPDEGSDTTVKEVSSQGS